MVTRTLKISEDRISLQKSDMLMDLIDGTVLVSRGALVLRGINKADNTA